MSEMQPEDMEPVEIIPADDREAVTPFEVWNAGAYDEDDEYWLGIEVVDALNDGEA